MKEKQQTIRGKWLMALALLVALPAAALELELGTLSTGDGGHGWGVIAEYGDGGPRTLTITRTTLPGLPPPDYWKRWGRLCNLRVYDPEGFLVSYVEMGDQEEATKTYTVKLPKGKAGRYRFSMAGGFVGKDTFVFQIPDPIAWGVRGEKILNLVGKNIPEKMYMAFAPTSQHFYLTGNNVSWDVKGEEGRSQHGAKAIQGVRPEGVDTIELTIDAKKGWMSLYCDGLPNTLSPTPEMAKRIMGGAVYAKDGTLCEGPIQAKLWDICQKICASEDLAYTEKEVAQLSTKIDKWLVTFLTNVVYDVKSPALGYPANGRAKHHGGFMKHPGFDFYHYDTLRYEPGNLADYAAQFPKDSRALKRAMVGAFAELAHMDGAAILRETTEGATFMEDGFSRRPLNGQRIDCATMFETMAGLGRAYKLLKDRLPSGVERIYREAVLDVCYKELGFMCYQSNQFMHIRECLNDVYCVTGDQRLGRCIKMELEAFMDNSFHGKHGQHPSGFFLEEYGPDGNYDQMSLRPMSVIYNTYRKVPGHDEALVEKMKACIEKNLHWRSLFEIVNPVNGAPYQIAYAMNHRTDGPTHFDSHNGLANLSNEFPLAYTMLKLGAKEGVDKSKLVPLPYDQWSYCEELDGFAAIKWGSFYAMNFYKVYDETPDGFLGPMFLWHKKAGLGLCGIKHSYHRQPHWFGAEMEERDITFPTVYGKLDGKLFIEARRTHKSFEWIKKGRSWKVTGICYQPPASRNAPKLERGTLSWTTDIVSNDVIEMTIESKFPDLQEAVVNLPILRQKGQTVWSHEGWRPSILDTGAGRYVQYAPGGTLTITWPKEVSASLVTDTPCTRGWCENLRLRMPANGKLKIRYEVNY